MKFESYLEEGKLKPFKMVCADCGERINATKKIPKKCPNCGSKDLRQFLDLFEAKAPNYKKAKIGGKVWMRMWKENPELQDEMLKWRKGEEAKFVKKLQKR